MRHWLPVWLINSFNIYINYLIDYLASQTVTLRRRQRKGEHAMRHQKAEGKRDGIGAVADRQYINNQDNHQLDVPSITVHRHHDAPFHRTTRLHDIGMWNVEWSFWKISVKKKILIKIAYNFDTFIGLSYSFSRSPVRDDRAFLPKYKRSASRSRRCSPVKSVPMENSRSHTSNSSESTEKRANPMETKSIPVQTNGKWFHLLIV